MTEEHGAPRRPVVLIILDGFGINPGKLNNAVQIANTPHIDHYMARFPHTTLDASGLSVGLPPGQMGNSEVGHLTLGAGHLVRQDLVIIDDSIRDHSFERNEVLLEPVKRTAGTDRYLHLIGLVSEGGVHSHTRHLYALINMCKQFQVKPMLHLITDGRDTPPQSALDNLQAICDRLEQADGKVGTVIGRYYAMDRDRRWDRTEMAWRAIVLGEGERAESARDCIELCYEGGIHDEFIPPTVIDNHAGLQDDDNVIFFNFRKDRPRQIVTALFKEDFEDFARPRFPHVHLTCMMAYDRMFGLPYAFEPERPLASLSQVVSDAGISQLHCAETEKYAHVTYFFNGGRSGKLGNEIHKLIPSPRVGTYDLMPEMSAQAVADQVEQAIRDDHYGLIIVNFANGDMVGHTAVRKAVIAAVETLDGVVGQVISAALECEYSVVLTADHGNCEELIDPVTNSPHTQHTAYPVPCLIIDSRNWQLTTGGGLVNIAPTVLQLMGLSKPPEMVDSLLLKPLNKANLDPEPI
jgi:2,3-bisphosphoglycerate-independent phosphoglycerate mutase